MGQACSRACGYQLLSKELNLPVESKQFDNNEKRKVNVFMGVTSIKWLQNISTTGKASNDEDLIDLMQNKSSFDKVMQPSFKFNASSNLVKCHVIVLKKDISFTLQLNKSAESFSDPSIHDILLNFSNTQKTNLKSFLQTYANQTANNTEKKNKECSWDELKILMQEIYDISVTKLNSLSHKPSCSQNKRTAHMLFVLSVIETEETVYILEQLPPHTIHDALTYSPAIFENNHINQMFVIYQILQIFQNVSQYNFKFDDANLSLNKIYLLRNSIWLGLSPFNCLQIKDKPEDCPKRIPVVKIYNGLNTVLNDASIKLTEELSTYTEAWIEGSISNFDYLVVINKLAGRKFGDSLNHPVFPWVTDFKIPYDGYRDLTKSKFRLNKGDRQLDATFSSGAGMFNMSALTTAPIQHHVSDVLSDITYYIYHARNTSKDILCSHVRSRWVPDEYPSSMERIYEWTPDECIPEFFYDENIFKTIHNDLPDLNVPIWLSSPKEFVEYHYKVLESNCVSEALHHWIDIMFGFKLSSVAAREEKNVHFSLVDQHTDLRNYGIVQLFSAPHPKKKYLAEEQEHYPTSKNELKVQFRDVSASWEYVDLTASMKRSKSEEFAPDQEDFLKRRKAKSFYETVVSATSTNSEDDYMPPTAYDIDVNACGVDFLDVLQDTEEVLFHELSIHPPDMTGIGIHQFGSFFDSKKTRDKFYFINDGTKLLLCLLIEITLQKETRVQTYLPLLDERFRKNVKLFRTFQHAVPSSIRYAIEDFLDPPSTVELNSPSSPPSSFRTALNFPPYFAKVHDFLSLLYTAVGDYQNTTLSTDDKMLLSTEIEKCVPHLQVLLDDLTIDGLHLLLVFLTPLFEIKRLQITMFLHLFSPICMALGPARSRSVFLRDLQKIYDSISTSDEVALLTQTFLSKVLSSFGQDVFLHYLMELILDVFLIDVPHITGPQIFHKSSCVSAPLSSELTYKSDSMMSYQMSPCVLTEVDSVSSFNLDNIFADQSENMVVLSKDYTHSFTDDGGSPSFNPVLENSLCDVNIEATAVDKLPVLSSQEVHSLSGMESLIEINTMRESLGEYSSSFPKCFEYSSSVPNKTVMADSPREENALSNRTSVSSVPFTMLLSNETSVQDGLEEAKEVLEEVPQEEELGIKEDEHASTFQHVDIYQTIVESVRWLMPWIGPILTTEYIAWPLLKRMSKILINTNGSGDAVEAIDLLLKKIAPVIDCLMEVALLYGDSIVLFLYLPHIAQLIESAITSPSVSISLGSSLVCNVQLMTEACKMLEPESILTHIEEFSVDFFQPLIRLLSTVKPFSTGSAVKEFLSRKLIDILGLLCQRLKREVAQDIMAPLLQQFFSCFDGIYALRTDENGEAHVTRKYSLLCQSFDKNNLGTRKRAASNIDNVKKFSSFDETDNGSFSLRSDRIPGNVCIDDVLQGDKLDESNTVHDEQFADIYDTFSPSLAYHAYVLFCRVMGPLYIEKTLYNSDLVWNLFTKHDKCLTVADTGDQGNSLKEVTETDGSNLKKDLSDWQQPLEMSHEEESKYAERSAWQHIDGKWFQHWSESKNTGLPHHLEFKDVKLQTYAGHSSVIRDFYVPDNEHYFLSASRDKTVKLWLLKNHGNGTAHLGYSRTYDRHTRAVFSVQGIESKRMVASCDGAVHIWDPVTGTTVCEFDVGRNNNITSMRTLPAPSTCLAIATTEGNMRLYDVRQNKFAQEWKLSPQTSIGIIRSICTNAEGTWIAAGFSSGIVSVLDLQVGILRGQARVHDGEIVQMEPVPGYGFISASVDSNIRMWHEDGNVSHILKSSNDSIHTVVYTKQQLLWSNTTNKLNIHSKERFSSFHTYRIGQDSFKGAVSKMAFLPINRLYLFGADNGNVMLYA